MIKVTQQMIEAGTEVAPSLDKEDITYLFASMYEKANSDIKAEELKKQLEYTRKLMVERINDRDALISKLMECIMKIGYDDKRTIDERISDFRDLCFNSYWCLRCNEYHSSGFCDYEDFE